MRRNAHWRVAKVARITAAEMYEFYATDNVFRKLHPDRRAWVDANYHKFFQPARAALAQSLSSSALSEDNKEEVIEALALDQSLINRKQPQLIIAKA